MPAAGVTFPAFGTTVGVWVTEPECLPVAESLLRDWVDVVDRSCSRFRPDSDLSRANAAAGTPVAVDATLLDAVDVALLMREVTGGWYDPMLGTAVIAAGYDRPFDEIRRTAPGRRQRAARPLPGAQVVVDREAGTLTVPEGVQLDLGGTAKGWAVDVALTLVRHHLSAEGADAGVCVSAGGDLSVAGPSPGGDGWTVHIAEGMDVPAGDGDPLLRLDSGAVATSGALRRRWRIGDVELHHLIDPRTGEPGASMWHMATVLAPTCAEADAAATAAWLMGSAAPAWLERLGYAGRLVGRDGEAVVVGDLPWCPADRR